MERNRNFRLWIDSVSEKAGALAGRVVVLLVLVGCWNALGRHLGKLLGVKLASNGLLELQWYLFSVVFLLGGAYCLRHDAHVRVDVLQSRFSSSLRARIEVLGTVLFLLPFCILVLATSWPSIAASWAMLEGSPDPGGLPRYPIKALLIPSFLLLALQGVAMIARREAPKSRDESRSGQDEAPRS